MSGFAGWFHRKGKLASGILGQEFLRELDHRGPDAHGIFLKSSTLLAQTKLHTSVRSPRIDYPVVCRESGVVLAGDLRLDNEDQLRTLLGSSSRTPEELVAAAYLRWGCDCAGRLLGDFAFAIWDHRKKGIFLARDHLGVKPLVFHLSDRVLAFGSEVGPLLRSPDVPREVNEARIADYLVEELEGIDETSTFYRHVERLPPAHCLWVDRHASRKWRYWQLQPGLARRRAPEENAEEFRSIFSEAIRSRISGVDRPAVMLSGGLDSVSIAALGQQQMGSGSSLKTYSVINPHADGCAETRSILKTVQAIPVDPVCIPTDAHTPLQPLDRLLSSSQDLFDNGMDLQSAVYGRAQQDGVKVVLDGVDADLVTSLGDGYLSRLAPRGALLTLLKQARGWARNYPRHYSMMGLLWGQGKRVFVPPWVSRQRRRISRRQRLRRVLETTMISPDFARQIRLSDRLEELDERDCACPSSTQDVHIRGITALYLSVALDRFDRVAARFGVQSCHPFLDLRLVEFCVSLPWQEKVSAGWSKLVLRRAVRRDVPKHVLWRLDHPHLGGCFVPPWLSHHNDRLKGELAVAMLSRYVNLPYLKNSWRRFSRARPNENDPFRLWEAVSLSNWLRRNRSAPV